MSNAGLPDCPEILAQFWFAMIKILFGRGCIRLGVEFVEFVSEAYISPIHMSFLV